eukprot:CAMPEP_0118932880 /NCGR_PEP_ID=MMETSP1169-20130426/10671_1 /TAXON_ID=36882 /ORGANISM="Pyramimonas obovata, Strain CCMP722" /LENGTH=47 /DNA_ID= /DNA_START= /DNA_END= /DNA_ORIENTATION=
MVKAILLELASPSRKLSQELPRFGIRDEDNPLDDRQACVLEYCQLEP